MEAPTVSLLGHVYEVLEVTLFWRSSDLKTNVSIDLPIGSMENMYIYQHLVDLFMVNVCKCRCIIYQSHGSYGFFSIEHYLTVKFQSFIGKHVEPWFASVQSFWKCPPLEEKKRNWVDFKVFAMRIKCVCVCSLSTLLDIYSIFVSIYIYCYTYVHIYIYITTTYKFNRSWMFQTPKLPALLEFLPSSKASSWSRSSTTCQGEEFKSKHFSGWKCWCILWKIDVGYVSYRML